MGQKWFSHRTPAVMSSVEYRSRGISLNIFRCDPARVVAAQKNSLAAAHDARIPFLRFSPDEKPEAAYLNIPKNRIV